MTLLLLLKTFLVFQEGDLIKNLKSSCTVAAQQWGEKNAATVAALLLSILK
jgi:hypothetical protein